MARFRAYVSDSDEEDDASNTSAHAIPDQPTTGKRDFGEDDSDSSDSEMLETELLTSAAKQKQPSKKALVQGDDGEYYHTHEMRRAETPTDVSTSESESEDDSPPPPNSRIRPDSSMTAWARQVGVEPQRMHVMQAALFTTDDPTDAQEARRLIAIPSSSSLHRKHSRDSDGEGLRLDSQQVRIMITYQILCSC